MGKKKVQSFEVDPSKIFDDVQRNTERDNQELRARSRKREELISSIDATVISVNGYNSKTSFTPASERRYGGSSPLYSGGDASYLEISIDSATPIKTLTFRGWPPLETGDSIRAYVLKAKLVSEKSWPPVHLPCRSEPKSHYVERDYKEQEKALKIEKLRNGKVVATYHN